MSRTRILAIGGGLLGATLLVALFLVLTGGDDEDVSTAPSSTSAASTTSTTEATTTTVEQGPVAPLTGLPVADAALLERPALIVKVDNVDYAARPQAGLNQADVIYEEQVEGGVTRFATIFHSQDAAQVGPIRSARSTDMAIAIPMHFPLFSFSGANGVFMALVRASPVVELSYDWHPELYTRVPDRPAPDDIFTPTATLFAVDHPESTAPPALFVYRGTGDQLPDGAVRVPGVTYEFGGAGAPVAFIWDEANGDWLRLQNGTPHVDADGVQIAPENVVVQFTDYIDTGLTDMAGTPVPEAQMVGEGDAWIFTDGQLMVARWSRAVMEDVTTYATADGDEVALTPGQTWVALALTARAQYTPCADLPPETAGC